MTLRFVKDGLLKGEEAVSEVQVLAVNDGLRGYPWRTVC